MHGTAVAEPSRPRAAQGSELLAIAPTGSGKTLAFLLPIIVADGLGAVGLPGEVVEHEDQFRELFGDRQDVVDHVLAGLGQQARVAHLPLCHSFFEVSP